MLDGVLAAPEVFGLFCASQDLVAKGGGVEAGLVVLSGLPVAVEVSKGFVDLEVVEGDVGDHLLLDGRGVGVVVDSILEPQGLELFVPVKAVLH